MILLLLLEGLLFFYFFPASYSSSKEYEKLIHIYFKTKETKVFTIGPVLNEFVKIFPRFKTSLQINKKKRDVMLKNAQKKRL